MSWRSGEAAPFRARLPPGRRVLPAAAAVVLVAGDAAVRLVLHLLRAPPGRRGRGAGPGGARASVSVEPGFPLGGGEAGLAAALLALKRRHRNLRSRTSYLARFDEALTSGVGGCQAGRAFLNVDHRGRVSKCVEFQGESDRVGDLTREGWDVVGGRLRRATARNECRSCWYASRGEVEALYTARGLVGALPALVRS